MQAITEFMRALIRDDRGAAVAEYSMIVTVLIGVVVGLMMLGTNVSDCLDTIGSLLRGLTGHWARSVRMEAPIALWPLCLIA